MTVQAADEIRLAFDEHEARAAHEEWGCNCGPAALAAALGKTLAEVRPAVEAAGFAEKRYTSPTMMQQALRYLRVPWVANPVSTMPLRQAAFPFSGLARIQWQGPWTAPGANPKWAYRATHWVASWQHGRRGEVVPAVPNPIVFDVNGGLLHFSEWVRRVVPVIVESIPRADGGWFVTHSWELAAKAQGGAS